MGRIRTVKPEFPVSESMGRVSRDARLCFVELFTVADDEGRLRAAPQLLTGGLFPYDADAPDKIDGWLSELEREGCIRRYTVGGTRLLQIVNWRRHQRIEHPSRSRLPAPPDELPAEAAPALAPDSAAESRASDAVADAASCDAGSPYTDVWHELWGEGILILEALGCSDAGKSRKMIGRWLRDTGDDAEAVLEAIKRARDCRAVDVIPWITQSLRSKIARSANSVVAAADAQLRKIRAGFELLPEPPL